MTQSHNNTKLTERETSLAHTGEFVQRSEHISGDHKGKKKSSLIYIKNTITIIIIFIIVLSSEKHWLHFCCTILWLKLLWYSSSHKLKCIVLLFRSVSPLMCHLIYPQIECIHSATFKSWPIFYFCRFNMKLSIALVVFVLPLIKAQVPHWGPCPEPAVQPAFNLKQVLIILFHT